MNLRGLFQVRSVPWWLIKCGGKQDGSAFLKLSSNVDVWHLRNVGDVCSTDRCESSLQRGWGQGYRLGAARLYLDPEAVDEATEGLDFTVQGGGSGNCWEGNSEKIPVCQTGVKRRQRENGAHGTRRRPGESPPPGAARRWSLAKSKKKRFFQKGCDQMPQSYSIMRKEKSHCIIS